jgi:hypothetical protein
MPGTYKEVNSLYYGNIHHLVPFSFLEQTRTREIVEKIVLDVLFRDVAEASVTAISEYCGIKIQAENLHA